MTNILMLGFSVTEMPSSYVPRLISLASARGGELDIDYCGIGGIGTESLPYFVDRIIATRPNAERIVFEIATSHARDVYRRNLEIDPGYNAVIWSHLASLIIKAREHGRDVAFVNLPRRDVDYKADPLESLIAQICIGYDVPLLSVSTHLMLRKVPVDTILTDDVHPNAAGAEIYAEKIYEFLRGLGQPRQILPLGSAPFASFAVKDQPSLGGIMSFRRHGFSEDYAVLEADSSITVSFGRAVRVEGIAALVGPLSGWLTIQTDIRNDLLFYDEFCYYERMMIVTKDFGVSDSITIYLSPTLPNIELLKNNRNDGPRRMGLFYLFYRDLVD